MSLKHVPVEAGDPRILMVSERALHDRPSRALRFEFEDRVQSLDAAELVSPDRPPISSPLVRRASRVLDRFAPGSSGPLVRHRPRLAAPYEVAFVAVESLYDLQLLQPLSWLLRSARISVCFIDEVWRKGLAGRKGELRLLHPFDHVLVGTAGTVEELAELSGRPCSYLPPSVDAVSLCPYPTPPPRVIDIYAMGRRSPATHRALLDLADRRNWFYMYDTIAARGVPDHREHRRHLAGLLRRTRYFLAYPGKVDAVAETGGQEEIGFRYFEGAAAGAVLVGKAPANSWFEKLLGWPDAVIPLPYGATEVEPALAALEADPVRTERARRTNVVESLLRHDHVYRWAEVLRRVGLSELPAMELRRRQLRELATAVSREAGTSVDGRLRGL
jgi:hypothetical protein